MKKYIKIVKKLNTYRPGSSVPRVQYQAVLREYAITEGVRRHFHVITEQEAFYVRNTRGMPIEEDTSLVRTPWEGLDE